MLNLVLTTDKLQLVTNAAATVDVHVSFVDLLSGSSTPGNASCSTVAYRPSSNESFRPRVERRRTTSGAPGRYTGLPRQSWTFTARTSRPVVT